MISGSRKKSHLACNHEAQISLKRWRRVSEIDSNLYFLVAATLCGKEAEDLWQGISRRCLRRNLSFLPGPSHAFLKYLVNSFGDESFFLPFNGAMGMLFSGYEEMGPLPMDGSIFEKKLVEGPGGKAVAPGLNSFFLTFGPRAIYI